MSETQSIPVPEAELLAGTERRISKAMWALGGVGTIVCFLGGGVGWGVGFAIGAVLSALNFRWMRTAADVLADAASGEGASRPAATVPVPGSAGPAADDVAGQPMPAMAPARAPRRHSAAVAVRFLFRYALIGLAGYAIFKSSFISLGAFFFGLFLFIAAILAEIAYQVYGAFRSA